MSMTDAILDWLRHMFSGRQYFVITLLICECLFSFTAQKRSYHDHKVSWLTIPAAVIVYLLIGLKMPMLPLGSFSVSFITFSIFAASVLLQWAVLDLSFWHVLFNSTVAYTVQNLGLNVYNIVQLGLGLTGWSSIILNAFIALATCVICYYCFAKRTQNLELNLNKWRLIYLTAAMLLITNFLFSFFAVQGLTRSVISVPLALCCVLSLQVQFGAFKDSNLNREKEILEQMLFREQKQHALLQETVDIINIKSHDLKNQIRILKKNGSNTDELIQGVEDALTSYNCLVDTGDKNLDLIVSEEKLFCEKYHIPFDVMAEGDALAFIHPADLYSLIGNALHNAVENSLKEQDQSRSITFDVHTIGGYVCIEIANFCSHPVEFLNGYPVTTKENTKFHGFGIKSMQYVVKKYKGNMVLSYQNNTFLVKVIFPVA